MQNLLKIVGFVLLAACSGSWETNYEDPLDPGVTRGWNVRDVTVQLPDTLTTTEENSYAPNADIVWHGEPFGDRKAQAARIVRDGISQGASSLRRGQPVKLIVTLLEFHALTPKARAQAPSAVHNISYNIQVVDARTGEPLTEPELIRADLVAFTGAAAVDAVVQGETQVVRITRHLRDVTAGWLGIGPDPRQAFSSAGR